MIDVQGASLCLQTIYCEGQLQLKRSIFDEVVRREGGTKVVERMPTALSPLLFEILIKRISKEQSRPLMLLPIKML